jgi:DNA-binding SARP family transcriptional activator/Tfp pilus assembly protein PilF
MLTFQLFGGCSLVSDGEVVTGPAAQRRQLALLTVLASSPAGGVSRDKLVGYFWPEEDRERARHFLSDALFRLRKSLGKDVLVLAGDDIRINPEMVDADVVRFGTLVAQRDLAGAVALYRGPFLDGFFVSDAPEFERWAEIERDRLARCQASCLEQLATLREGAGDWAGAAEWWRRLTVHDPYSSRVALRTMLALDAAGDPAEALQHSRGHEARVREELGLECDPAIAALAERLRTRPPSPQPASHSGAPAPRRLSAEAPSVEPARNAVPVDHASLGSIDRAPRARHLESPRTLGFAALVVLGVAAAGLAARMRQAPALTTAPISGPSMLVSPGPLHVGSATRTRREQARELYTQGRYHLSRGQFDPAIHHRALQLFQQATKLDPSFALAYTGMADVYNHADDPVRAKQAALRAISLDSSLAEAHTALSYVLANYEYRWAAADSALQRAIALNPRYVLAHLRRANELAAQGRIDEAVAAVERAREIQPESFVVLLNRGLMADIAGRPADAIAHFQAALVMEPGRVDAQAMLVRAYWGQSRYAEAQGIMRSLGNMAGVAAMSGNRDTMALLAPLFASSNVSDSIRLAAALYVRLGRTPDAFEQLDRLYRRRDKHLALGLRQQPFVSLAGDPRYARLLARLGLR